MFRQTAWTLEPAEPSMLEIALRKVVELQAAGLVRRAEGGGFLVAPHILDAEGYRIDSEATLQAIRTVCADLRALDFDVAAFGAAPDPVPARALDTAERADLAALLANVYLLHVLNACVEPHDSMLDAASICTLI
ncbi:hypothetical protein MCEMIH16_01152 [Caulobacteraceae bacterium]